MKDSITLSLCCAGKIIDSTDMTPEGEVVHFKRCRECLKKCEEAIYERKNQETEEMRHLINCQWSPEDYEEFLNDPFLHERITTDKHGNLIVPIHNPTIDP